MVPVMLLPSQLLPSLLASPSEVQGLSLLVRLPPFAADQQLQPFSDVVLPTPMYRMYTTVFR